MAKRSLYTSNYWKVPVATFLHPNNQPNKRGSDRRQILFEKIKNSMPTGVPINCRGGLGIDNADLQWLLQRKKVALVRKIWTKASRFNYDIRYTYAVTYKSKL